MTLTVEQLNVFPVKSLSGIALDSVECLATGLRWDRNWVVIDGNNKFISQRQLPAMAAIKVQMDNRHLILHHKDSPELAIPLQLDANHSEQVTVWNDDCPAWIEPEGSSEWLTSVLGEFRGSKLRLARFDQNGVRKVAEKYLPNQDASLHFADACPYLFTFQESLDSLNQALAKPIPMDRFRANIVLSGLAAWQEYQLSNITSASGASFDMVGPCQRCQMTSIDQQNGVIATPGEPLKTLMSTFPVTGKTAPYFGQHAKLASEGNAQLNVGGQLVAI